MSKPAARRKPMQVILGVVLVILAFGGVLLFSRLSGGGGGGPVAQVSIVGAKHDIKTGQKITVDDLAMIKVDALPTGGLTTFASADGKIARQDVASGQPVLDADLATPSQAIAAKLYFALPAGSVALNIPAADISPYVQPGDQIDVISSLKGGASGTQVKTTLKGLKVLSVGVPGTPAAGNLVVAVKLQDAEVLVFAVHNTDFIYVLKSPLDASAADPATTGVDLPTFKQLYGFR